MTYPLFALLNRQHQNDNILILYTTKQYTSASSCAFSIK